MFSLVKKIVLFFVFFCLILFDVNADQSANYKIYGFIRNDLYFNSRQNFEVLDGIFNIYPKPIDNETGSDINAVQNAQMIAISSRLGIDFTGATVLGAKSSAKIECDFAGVSQYYYLVRLRQAYLKLNWNKTELLIGQTWHPMFANLQPVTPALSVATPFQSFNRSPQIRFTYKINDNLSFQTAAAYQMQYLTQGPVGASNSYMKTGLFPGLFASVDYKNKNMAFGAGVDGKSLLINKVRFNSGSAFAYAHFTLNKFQIRAKSVLGQNMSEYLMLGGYGVSGSKAINSTITVNDYTNINTATSWLSLAYGSKTQIGIYGGFMQNLGAQKMLTTDGSGRYTLYGYGYYQAMQLQMNSLFRIAPHIQWTISNIKLALEYEYTNAEYGTIQENGKVINPYHVDNHRALATISYLF